MKVLVSIIGLLTLIGCSTSKPLLAKYDVHMVEVERPVNATEMYGPFKELKVDTGNKYFYADSIIDATFLFGNSAIAFSMLNKSQSTMKIIWDETVFIEADKTSTKVMHVGVKYSERSNSMPPTIIPKGIKIEDEITPVNRVRWRDGYYSTSISIPGGWDTDGILPTYEAIMKGPGEIISEKDYEPFIKKANSLVGSKLGLLMPFEIGGVKNEYTFWFEVKGAEVDTTQPKRIF